MRKPFASNSSRSNEPASIYGYRVYLLAFSATWASACFGYDSAFIGGTLALPSFKNSYGLANESKDRLASLSSNIVSTFQGGAFFGALFGFYLSERFGRKFIIMTAGVVFSVGAILQLVGHLGLLYAGRVLTGLGIGSSSLLIPIYISECAPPSIRGRLVGIFEIMLQIALVIGFWVNYGVNKNISSKTATQWRIPVGIQLIPSCLLVISMAFMIESPRWLASKGRNAKARTALSWVQNLPEDHDYINQEIQEIEAGIEHEIEMGHGRTDSLQIVREIGAPGVRNRVAIAVGLMLLQNLTGINAVNYYSPTIFKAIGVSGTSVGLLATGVYGLVKFFTTLVFMVFVVDKFGRRTPLIVGSIGAAIAMFYLGAYSKLSNSFNHKPKADGGAHAAIAMVYIYAIFYGFSWNGIPWIVSSEILPTRVRTLGMMLAVCMQWLAQFMIVYSLPHMVISIKYGIFFFFGACTIVAMAIAYFFVPETKGVALEDMDLIFGPDVSIMAKKAYKDYLVAKENGINAAVLYSSGAKDKELEKSKHIETRTAH